MMENFIRCTGWRRVSVFFLSLFVLFLFPFCSPFVPLLFPFCSLVVLFSTFDSIDRNSDLIPLSRYLFPMFCRCVQFCRCDLGSHNKKSSLEHPRHSNNSLFHYRERGQWWSTENHRGREAGGNERSQRVDGIDGVMLETRSGWKAHLHRHSHVDWCYTRKYGGGATYWSKSYDETKKCSDTWEFNKYTKCNYRYLYMKSFKNYYK